jgi:hypothetical protein
MTDYPNILEAAEGLLGDVVGIVGEMEPYVVIGGWSPFLLNSKPIQHPGTKDVDLLFEEAATPLTLGKVVDALCANGYRRSAKHEFQLLKVLPVAGVEFVFNVDLLHPSEPDAKVAEFVDHLSLPVPLSQYRDDEYFTKSIGTPGTCFIFDGHYQSVSHDFRLPDGSRQALRIPLMTECGTVLTKCASAGNPKRVRDAFDIFLAIEQARSRDRLLAELREVRDSHPEAFNALFTLKWFLETRGSQFIENICTVLDSVGIAKPVRREGEHRAQVQRSKTTIESLLLDIPLPPLASQIYASRGGKC